MLGEILIIINWNFSTEEQQALKYLAFEESVCNRCFAKLSVWADFRIDPNTVSFSLNLKFQQTVMPRICQ